MKWHSAPELLPLTDFPAEPISAQAFHPAVWKVVPSGRAVRRPPDGAHRGSACASPRCRSMPVSSVRVQAVHPDVGWILLPPRCLEDQESLTAGGDQASDLDFLVAGAGFEPATSGL